MRLSKAFLPLLFLAALLAGCGGGGGSTDTSTTQPPTQTTTSTKGAQEKGGVKQGKDSEKAKAQPTPDTAAPPISSAPVEGTKAAAPGVKTVKGGDNSVQTYGTESNRSDLVAAATTAQAYFNARIARDWAKACTYLNERSRANYEQLAAQARKNGKDIGGCAGVMAALSKGVPDSALRQSATIEKVLSFRSGGELRGDPAFLIFLGPPKHTPYSMPMSFEGGAWKVGALAASALPV